MSRPFRLLAAALVVLAGSVLVGCGGNGTYVDSTTGQRIERPALGWATVDPISVDLPTGDPITEGAAVPDRSVPVLVNLWASWCAPCKKELPLLQEVDASGALQVIGFSRDRFKDSAADALRKAGVTYPNWLDADARLALDLDGRVPYASVPSSVLIRDGQVVAVHIGEFKTRDDVMKALDQP